MFSQSITILVYRIVYQPPPKLIFTLTLKSFMLVAQYAVA